MNFKSNHNLRPASAITIARFATTIVVIILSQPQQLSMAFPPPTTTAITTGYNHQLVTLGSFPISLTNTLQHPFRSSHVFGIGSNKLPSITTTTTTTSSGFSSALFQITGGGSNSNSNGESEIVDDHDHDDEPEISDTKNDETNDLFDTAPDIASESDLVSSSFQSKFQQALQEEEAADYATEARKQRKRTATLNCALGIGMILLGGSGSGSGSGVGGSGSGVGSILNSLIWSHRSSSSLGLLLLLLRAVTGSMLLWSGKLIVQNRTSPSTLRGYKMASLVSAIVAVIMGRRHFQLGEPYLFTGIIATAALISFLYNGIDTLVVMSEQRGQTTLKVRQLPRWSPRDHF